MTTLLEDPRVIWALALIVLVPAIVVGLGEYAERLRQRDSAFRPVVSIVRGWAVPLLALWVVLRVLLGRPPPAVGVRIVETALLVTVAIAALALVRVLVARHRGRERGDSRPRVPQLLLALPRVVIVLVAAWVLLDGIWGVDLSAALTALGVGSLVISLALQDTLSGLASGVLLVGDAPFRPGDWIQYGQATDSGRPEGRVVDVNWRSTRVENRDGDLVVVPNATLATATLINFDRPTRLHRVVVPVQVAYVNPPTAAKAMLLDAARSTPHVLADPAPQIHVVQIDDPLMGYEAHMWIDDYRVAPQVSSDFGTLVWYQSHRHDVPLPSPAYDLYVYDGVAASEAGRPDQPELVRRLRASPLVAQLGDDDVERLAAGAGAARYAQGETIVTAATDRADVYVLTSGRARVVATAPDGEVATAGELGPGDVFGLFSRVGDATGAPRVVAVTDCEVAVIDADAAAEVIGRNAALSTAIEQIVAMQRRRVERITTPRAATPVVASDGRGPDGQDAATGAPQ
jgi:small-conductance mechanosensitive channel